MSSMTVCSLTSTQAVDKRLLLPRAEGCQASAGLLSHVIGALGLFRRRINAPLPLQIERPIGVINADSTNSEYSVIQGPLLVSNAGCSELKSWASYRNNREASDFAKVQPAVENQAAADSQCSSMSRMERF